MKAFSLLAAAAILSQSHPALARIAAASDLVTRSKASIAGSLFELIGLLIPDDGPVKTWEIEDNPNMCKIYMTTKDGGNCYAEVECDDGKRAYNKDEKGWNVCYVGGRQYFTDPRIGDFSITFTEKDGEEEGEGLTTPVLQLKHIGDWEEIPVTPLASDYEFTKDDIAAGPFVCHWGWYDLSDPFTDYITENRRKIWECGIPKIGKGGAGLDSNGPVNDQGYRPGTCRVHVVQYQKPDPEKDDYSLEISTLVDDNENQIGGLGKSGPDVSLTSKLPLTLEIKTGNVDADPIYFAYGADSWDSNNEDRCSVGGYDSGNRDMDCTFQCD